MRARTVILSLAALVCLAAAYRFASHGIPQHDNRCIAYASTAFAVAVLLSWAAFRRRLPKRDV